MAQTGSGKTTMFMAPLLALLAAGRRREGQAAAAATPNAVMAVTEATKPRIVSTKRRRTDTDTPVAQCAVKPEIRSRTAPSCSPESLSSSSSSSLNTAPSGSPCPMLPGVLVLVPTRELVVQHVRVAAALAAAIPIEMRPLVRSVYTDTDTPHGGATALATADQAAANPASADATGGGELVVGTTTDVLRGVTDGVYP